MEAGSIRLLAVLAEVSYLYSGWSIQLSRAENVTGLKPRTEAAGGRAFGAPAVAERSVGR